MTIGTGAALSTNVPVSPFVVDPQLFAQLTTKNIVATQSAAYASGGFTTRQLLQTGIKSKIVVKFEGSMVVATGGATAGIRYPYGLVDDFTLSVNGQNDLWSCDGLDLTALRFCRYPAFTEHVDLFPGSVGGGAVAAGTYPISLSYEVPIATDPTNLIGALYAQSGATSVQASLRHATPVDLFSANDSRVTITGTWTITETFYTVPVDDHGQLVIPDLTRLHGFTALDTPFQNVGEVRTALIRSQGQLHRLFVSAEASANSRLSALPATAAASKIDSMRVEYGGNQRPANWTPASILLAENNQHYGAPVPYDRIVWDLIRENPIRDVVLMQGVTELAVTLGVNAAVTPSAGNVRMVQETLY